jgi:glycosyltransferase involved in cell wall biosynthesis
MTTKIFIEAHAFDHGFEGSATYLAGLYRSLLKCYPDQYSLVVGGQHPEKAIAALGSPPQAIPAKYRSRNRITRLSIEVPRILRETKPDFAHFQYFTPIVKSCRWIVTIHDVLFNDFPQYFPLPYRGVRNLLFPLSASRADILATVSPYSRDRISHWYGIPSERILVTPNGVELSKVDNRARTSARAEGQPNGRYLICVSRFEPRKNQIAVLNAFLAMELWRRDLSLVFVGARTLKSPEFDKALANAPDGARRKVHILPSVSAEALVGLFAGAEAAVYPSLAEGFGLPPLEALGMGIPSICANVTAMADFDVLQNFFFDPACTGSLEKKLADILANPKKAQADAVDGAWRLGQQYSWSASAEILHRAISAGQTKGLQA